MSTIEQQAGPGEEERATLAAAQRQTLYSLLQAVARVARVAEGLGRNGADTGARMRDIDADTGELGLHRHAQVAVFRIKRNYGKCHFLLLQAENPSKCPLLGVHLIKALRRPLNPGLPRVRCLTPIAPAKF